jgi:hypothetical protein
MDPITQIVTALATGAAAAIKDMGGEAVKDAYNGLKALIMRKFGAKAGVNTAIASVEKKPDSDSRKGVLREELKAAGADRDEELLKQAQAFLVLLQNSDAKSGVSYTATNTGSGAIAQGQGSVAAGEGGVAIGGNVGGDIGGSYRTRKTRK